MSSDNPVDVEEDDDSEAEPVRIEKKKLKLEIAASNLKVVPAAEKWTGDTLKELFNYTPASANGNASWTCCVCGEKKQGSGSRMLGHAKKHPRLKGICELYEAKWGRKEKQTASDDRQQKISKLLETEGINDIVAKYSIQSMIPDATVEHPHFRSFCEELLKLGRENRQVHAGMLMKRTAFKARVDDMCSRLVQAEEGDFVTVARTQGATIVFDGRNNIRHDGLVAICVESRERCMIVGTVDAGTQKKDVDWNVSLVEDLLAGKFGPGFKRSRPRLRMKMQMITTSLKRIAMFRSKRRRKRKDPESPGELLCPQRCEMLTRN
jgi:hypothetical protein